MKKTLAILTLGLLAACASERKSSTGLDLMSENQYKKVLSDRTRHAQQYAGLHNVMDVTATILNPGVIRAQIEQSARLSQWDAARFQQELNKADDDLRRQTKLFLSFYTPERKNDDLHKKSTTWRIYLQGENQRWEGTATKMKESLAEIQGLYPYHNRFATAYMVSFPVAATEIDGRSFTVKITGPVGSTDLSF